MNKRQRKKAISPWVRTRSGLKISAIFKTVDKLGDCSMARMYPVFARVEGRELLLLCDSNGYYLDESTPHALDLMKRSKL